MGVSVSADAGGRAPPRPAPRSGSPPPTHPHPPPAPTHKTQSWGGGVVEFVLAQPGGGAPPPIPCIGGALDHSQYGVPWIKIGTVPWPSERPEPHVVTGGSGGRLGAMTSARPARNIPQSRAKRGHAKPAQPKQQPPVTGAQQALGM